MMQTVVLFAGARIESFGWQAFYRRPVRQRVLAILEWHGLGLPERWGTGDRPPDSFDRNRYERAEIGPGPFVLELLRDTRPSWKLYLSMDDRAWLSMSAQSETLDAIGPEKWFELADAVADALEPDCAFAHLNAALSAVPSKIRDERAAIDSNVLEGVRYYSDNTLNLPMRTWFGPRLLRQIDRAALNRLSPPAAVSDTAWDGVRIDLLPKPWQADALRLVEVQRAAMQELRTSGLFRSAKFDRGGVAREAALGFRLDQIARGNGPDNDEPGPDPAPLLAAARTGKKVEDMVLSWADLKKADLSGLNADGLVLDWAELNEAELPNARLKGCSFISCDLTKARLNETTITNCTLRDAVAPQSVWRKAEIVDATCTNMVGEHADFEGARISQTSFDGAMLSAANFAAAELRSTSFRAAECGRTSFIGTTLDDVDFSGADLRGADFTGAKLGKVNFMGARRDPEGGGTS